MQDRYDYVVVVQDDVSPIYTMRDGNEQQQVEQADQERMSLDGMWLMLDH